MLEHDRKSSSNQAQQGKSTAMFQTLLLTKIAQTATYMTCRECTAKISWLTKSEMRRVTQTLHATRQVTEYRMLILHYSPIQHIPVACSCLPSPARSGCCSHQHTPTSSHHCCNSHSLYRCLRPAGSLNGQKRNCGKACVPVRILLQEQFAEGCGTAAAPAAPAAAGGAAAVERLKGLLYCCCCCCCCSTLPCCRSRWCWRAELAPDPRSPPCHQLLLPLPAGVMQAKTACCQNECRLTIPSLARQPL